MITIEFPNNFESERRYILSVMFEIFLGLKPIYKASNNAKDYTIIFDNDVLIVEDAFFSRFNECESYIDKRNIPNKIEYLDYNDLYQIPILYGKANIITEPHRIRLQADVFASAFFMLSRWEEVAVDALDKWHRFVSSEALAVKYGFIRRPVVQEYLALLVGLMPKSEQKNIVEQKYRVTATHDIDHPLLWNSWRDCFKSMAGDLLKRHSFCDLMTTLKYVIQNKDPYNTIEYLMRLSDENNIISRFYFLFSAENCKNSLKAMSNYAKIIAKSRHEVGIHLDIGTYNNWTKLKQQIVDYENMFGDMPKHNRQHYLQLSAKSTFGMLDDASIVTDSSLYYSDCIGFRSGSCYDYPLFDLKDCCKLNIVEQTLCFMDRSALNLSNRTEAMRQVCEVIDNTKQYGGHFVLLWHNSNFNTSEWSQLSGMYEEIIRYATK